MGFLLIVLLWWVALIEPTYGGTVGTSAHALLVHDALFFLHSTGLNVLFWKVFFVCVLGRYWCSLFNVLFFLWDNASLVNWEASPPFLFCGSVCVNLVSFLPKILSRIYQWNHLDLYFFKLLFLKIIIGLFRLSISLWGGFSSLTIMTYWSISIIEFMCIEVFIAFPYYLLPSASVVISSPLFPTWVICVFFLALLARLKFFLLIFSKNQFLALFILYIAFLFCFLLHIIFFLPLSWVYFLFSILFLKEVTQAISLRLSFFYIISIHAINFLLSIALAASTSFDMLYMSFCSLHSIFYYRLILLHWPTDYLEAHGLLC